MQRPRILMTPGLLQLKKDLTATDTAFESRWMSLKAVGSSNALKETSREWLPTLATMSLLTDDPRYATRVEALVSTIPLDLSIISRDDGKPVGQEVFQLALAYDWLRNRLSTPTLERMRQLLASWGTWVWPETNPTRMGKWGTEAPWDNYYYEFLRGSWLAGIALKDDTPVAEDLIRFSRDKWLLRAKFWLENNQPGGFFSEGSNYGIGALVSILQCLCSNKIVTGESLPGWVEAAQGTMIDLTSPGMNLKAPFGDQSSDYKGVHSDTDRLAMLLLSQFGSLPGTCKWWLDNIGRSRTKRAQSFWFEFMYYPSNVSTANYYPRTFGIDWPTGYMISTSGLGRNEVKVQAVCGPTFSTHQDAAGTFIITVGNDPIVDHAKRWSEQGTQHNAVYVNCLTVNDRGQNNQLDKTARVTVAEHTTDHTIWTMEGGQAYDFDIGGGQATRFIKPLVRWTRSLIFKKPNIVFLYDRVEKREASTSIRWNLNIHKPPVLNVDTFLVTEGITTMEGFQWLPNPFGIPEVRTLNLAPSAGYSSTLLSVAPKIPKLVEEFLFVFQLGQSGFNPLPHAKSAQGYLVGDTELVINPDGSVTLGDRKMDVRQMALLDLRDAIEEWDDSDNPTDEETLIPPVVEAARALISIVDRTPITGE